ncbi:hypothetical protein [Methanolobus sp. WCC4]|uniref:hypothetical protein n=1 Tax=Methanolobus sp. WCC4 TaxID=3125784 RepID=UPI0030F68C3E
MTNEYKTIIAAILTFTSLVFALFVGQLLWGIIAALMIISLLIFSRLLSGNAKTEEQAFEELEVCVLTNSSIYKVPTFFVGIPIIVVLGELGSKYESVFLAEHEGKEVTVIYPGICSVMKDDRLKIRGIDIDGKKAGVTGKCLKASSVMNLRG